MEVAKLVSAGMSDREIADNLVISVHTVRTHVKRIRQKLGIRGRGWPRLANTEVREDT